MKQLFRRYSGLWERLTGPRLFLFYALHYTLVFALLAPLIFRGYSQAGKSFVWTTDGINQHYNRLLYISSCFRQSFKDLLSGNGWSFPLYDFRTGIVTQDLQLGLPHLLAALWPVDRMNEFYQVLVVGNYYFIGLSFSALGFYFRQKPLAVLAGALSFAFSGYGIYAGVRHPHFVVPMIWLPLLIIGTEQVLRKRPAWLLTFTVLLSLCSQWGLYFSCMQGVLVVLYALIRYLCRVERKSWRDFWAMVGRLLVWGGIGVLLGCAVAIPSLLNIMGSDRVGGNFGPSSLLYWDNYYRNFLATFLVKQGTPSAWTCLGFSVLTLPAVALLLARWKRAERDLRVMLLVLTGMLMFPAVGYVMSGFSNIANRFCFGYALLTAVILMRMLSELPKISLGRKLTALGITAAVCLAAYLLVPAKLAIAPFVYWFILAALVLGALLTALLRRHPRLLRTGLLLITCASVCLTAYTLYSPEQDNYVGSYAEDPRSWFTGSQFASLSYSTPVREDPDFFRVAASQLSGTSPLGGSFLYDLNALTGYPYYGWSGRFAQWYAELELPRYGNKHKFFAPDVQTIPLCLGGIKYLAKSEDSSTPVPYGFTLVDRVENPDRESPDLIYRNENYLPLGYTYSAYISRDRYEQLSALEKAEAMLQAAVLEQSPKALPEAALELSALQIPAERGDVSNLKWKKDGTLKLQDGGSYLELTFESLPMSETYLRVVGLDLTKGSKRNEMTVKASGNGNRSRGHFMTDNYVYTHHQKDMLLSMGWDSDSFGKARLSFPSGGTYRMEDVQIWCQPLDRVARQTAALREDRLEDVRLNPRGLTGSITLEQDKLLCLTIPWLEGWTALVDGAPAELLHVNTAYMGLELTPGTHTVELRYELAGLKPGLLLSLVGLICLIALIIYRRKHRAQEVSQ